MAYAEELAERVRHVLTAQHDPAEKRMFGGVAFMVRGNMACGIRDRGLIIRVGPDRYEQALLEPHTRPFDPTGRPMRGWVVVQPEGYASNDDLRAWVEEGLAFALSLPPK